MMDHLSTRKIDNKERMDGKWNCTFLLLLQSFGLDLFEGSVPYYFK